LAALVLATAGAQAQNYDGTGIVKFGVFGQYMGINYDQKAPLVGSGTTEGAGGGLSFGYDMIFGQRFLLGAEIDAVAGDARTTFLNTNYGFDYSASIRGRIGFFVHPGWLLYGTAGAGWLGFEAGTPGFLPSVKAAINANGYVVGAGTEVDWSHVIVFGEYLYGDYGSRNFTLLGTTNTTSIDAHFLRLGLKFKVGHDYAHDFDHPDDYRSHRDMK
jgi:opacity protein-like surface antigen